ncbi:hypothetical protein HAP47_0008315 [Bradyrhizobium sp. 41S5]|uniref:hypothetical protein n=1 Tax=Bradyrhizobium sp. 41S5 TaxID=1404443 RepID=UPI00156BB798|nr:hypothetical protein [Bradyrhizobium sp. 41S5]UFX46662.1 hypothetical protein HAP47_0008315 [Bradyrhizobium sp. 41S5]
MLLRTRPDGSRFAVTQQTEIRTEIAGDMAVRTLLPIAALVPCLLLMTAFVIARSFRPMLRLAGDLDARRVDDVVRCRRRARRASCSRSLARSTGCWGGCAS